MRKKFLAGGLGSLALAFAIVGATSLAGAQATPQADPGAMSPWMMGPCGHGMMGWGMRGPGMMGRGMMGRGWGQNTAPANLNLSANDVKGYLQQWLVMAGNARLKVGAVIERDADTITADIVTTEKDALVQRFSINRHTGFYSLVE